MTLSAGDLAAIHRLYADYSRAIDAGDAEAWLAVFVPDGTFSATGIGTFRGEAALRGFAEGFSRTEAGQLLRHWTNNITVEGATGGARGACYLAVLQFLPGSAPAMGRSGRYTDNIVRTPAGWRFATRTLEFDA